jgi:hypothetical protein
LYELSKFIITTLLLMLLLLLLASALLLAVAVLGTEAGVEGPELETEDDAYDESRWT